MRAVLLILSTLLALVACQDDNGDTKSGQAEVSNSTDSTALRRDSRRRLLNNRTMAHEEVVALGEDFADKMDGITLVEARECRISYYAMSEHFEDEREDGFDGDFRKWDRTEGFAQHLTFAYFGFDRAVKRLEIERAMAAMGNAPESVKRQAIREGIDHSTAENLIWCDFEDLEVEDMETPSFRTFCTHYNDYREQQKHYRVWKDFHKFCHSLLINYLEDGIIDQELYLTSPLR